MHYEAAYDELYSHGERYRINIFDRKRSSTPWMLRNFERSKAIIAYYWTFRDVDVVDSWCPIGEMAGRITTRLGTVTLQVGTSSSSES